MKPQHLETEKDVEARLSRQCRDRGWYCRKFVSPGYRSVPDRIVVVPNGNGTASVFFIELKKPGAEPTKDQLAEHKELRALGANVTVLDNRRDVDAWCESIAAFCSYKQGGCDA